MPHSFDAQTHCEHVNQTNDYSCGGGHTYVYTYCMDCHKLLFQQEIGADEAPIGPATTDPRIGEQES